jgi:hypothetical protein
VVGGLRLTVLAAAVALLLQSETVPEVTPMQLEQDKDLLGKTVTVVGRVDAWGSDLIWLKKCRVHFRGTDLPRIPGAENVALTGTLEREKDRLVFRVRRLQRMPSDTELFDSRYQRHAKSPGELDELGHWARRQGMFYEDKELLELARKAYERALALREAALPDDEVDAMLDLTHRAEELAVSMATVLRLKHHAYRIALVQTPKSDAPALRKLGEQIEAGLDGTDVPTRAADAPLIQDYSQAPLRVYQNATQAQRAKLHRVLWGDTVQAALTAEWEQQKRDGFDLALEAQRLLPERPLAETLTRRTLERDSADPKQLSRKRSLLLAEQYRKLGQDDAAEQLLLDWIRVQVAGIGPRDAERRVELADEYLRLGREQRELSEARRKAAQELLLEAWDLAQLPEAARRLTQLGLVFHDDGKRWLTREEFDRTEFAEQQRQIRIGKVAAGMTAEQVLQARSRRPDEVVRIGTRGRLEEQWIYDIGDNHRDYINLVYSISAKQWLVESFYSHP